MPDMDILYLGDHANAPYGHRSNAQILDWTQSGVSALFDRGASVVILACNTAAAIALRTLQQSWLANAYPDRRVLGVLVPMVEAVTGQPWHAENTRSDHDDTVILFATAKTIQSRAYRDEVAKRAPGVRLIEQACPGLVDAIEGGAGARPLKGLVEGYVAEALDKAGGPAPSAVLGCTHFPLVEPMFRAALPAPTQLYGQPELVARALVDYRRRHASRFAAGTGTLRLLTTGDPEALKTVAGLPGGLPPFERLV